MGTGPRVRRAYRVLSVAQGKGSLEHRTAVYRIAVEPMSAERGREAIAEGTPTWELCWDRRQRRSS
jgi:hypothetical protein